MRNNKVLFKKRDFSAVEKLDVLVPLPSPNSKFNKNTFPTH